jgi:hypothetical protein
MNGGAFETAAECFEEVKMRRISLLIAGTLLASCMAAPPMAQGPDPRAAAEYQQLVGGKVAQAPIECLPNYYANDMRTIDGQTLGFRVGGSRAYIAHLTPGCELIGTGNYTLLTRQVGGMGLCRGDIEQVVDTSSHAHVGSCAIAQIIPYYRP